MPCRLNHKTRQSTLPGCDTPVTTANENGALAVTVPFITPDELKCSELYTFRIEG